MSGPVTEFRLERDGALAVLEIDSGDPERPAVFGPGAFASLASALDEIESELPDVLVVTGRGSSFAAGADLDEFPKIASREQAIAASRAGHELFGRLRALECPTVAAINGACLGGGLELALHCDHRVAAEGVRHIGAPEVLLGFVPGWGGTQLTPRTIGVEAAVKVIVLNPLRQNRLLDASKAADLGLVDEVVAAEDLHICASQLPKTGVRPRHEMVTIDPQEATEVVRRARSQVDDAVHGAAPAPYRALELIELAGSTDLEAGLKAEAEALADLLATPQAQASLYAFDLVERRAKRKVGRPDAEARPIAKVGLAGAGLMATQLATLVVRRLQVPVVLRDLDEETVSRGVEGVRDELAAAAARGRIDQETAVALAAMVSGSTEWAPFADCDLVIEAVFEELGVKRQVFGELEAVVRDQCVLATNTSALSVTDMGRDLRHPERLVGIHFFNPVALMPLVELIRTPETDDATLAAAWDVSDRLRKRPVLVRDAPGFVVNRLLARMMIVVQSAVESGNTVEDADDAVLSLGLPMAPSVLLQMVGPQVAEHVRETLHAAYPDRFAVETTTPRSRDELREAVLEALADETRHLLDEGVVASAKDVDTALLLGAGFPFFLGGITKHLDQTGVSDRIAGRTLADHEAVRAATSGP